LRTVTGLIGKANRSRYRLETETATIGIRGTEFAATADAGTRVNVTQGVVALCTNEGCIDIARGQSGFAGSRNAKPVLSFTAALLPPVARDEQPDFVAAERRDSTGASISLLDVSAAPVAVVAPVVPLPNGPGGIAVASVTTGGSYAAGLVGGTVAFTGGLLTQFIDCCVAATNYTAGVSSDFGSDGIIAWGRWTGGLGQSGQPLSTMAYVANVSANNVTASGIVRGYASFASSAPIITSGGSIVATGAQNSVTGSLTVNFASIAGGGGTLSYALSVPVAGQTFSLTGNAAQLGTGTGFLGTTSTITSSGAGCASSCTGNIPFGDAFQGVFTGSAAERAGGIYGFNSQLGKVSGSVVFQ
jgi:hypothetical protein